jgi:hypothetical protein
MRSCFGPRVSSFDAEEGQAHCALLKAPCSFYKQRSPDARRRSRRGRGSRPAKWMCT